MNGQRKLKRQPTTLKDIKVYLRVYVIYSIFDSFGSLFARLFAGFFALHFCCLLAFCMLIRFRYVLCLVFSFSIVLCALFLVCAERKFTPFFRWFIPLFAWRLDCFLLLFFYIPFLFIKNIQMFVMHVHMRDTMRVSL